MPIANCFINFDLPPERFVLGKNIVSLWAEEAELASAEEHMTINFVKTDAQQGVRYTIMAWLYLPTVWSDSQVDTLQLSLGRVLTKEFDLKPNEVQVITVRVNSGQVVENGETVNW